MLKVICANTTWLIETNRKGNEAVFAGRIKKSPHLAGIFYAVFASGGVSLSLPLTR